METKEIKSIERKMVEGHDDFRDYYFIEKKDWDKLNKGVENEN